MNIKTLRVQNFRNFEDKTFEFSEGFNLIIGDNGTGKTALLEAIAVSLGGYLSYLERGNRHIRDTEVRVKSILIGETYTQEQQYPVVVTTMGNIMGKNLEWSRDCTEQGMLLNSSRNIQELSMDVQTAIQAGNAVTLPIVNFYSTARLWLERPEIVDTTLQNSIFSEQVLNPSSRRDGYKNALEIAINNKSWLNWLAKMEIISLQNKKPMKVFEAVKKALQACLEGCDLLYFNVQRGEPIARIHGKPMPFSLLSDGQRSMLAMVADIAYRMAQLNPHLLENVTLETPGVVLIDELDLHLHPKWQRKVVDNLRKAFPKVQFFATTHSPFIIQSVRQGELIDLNETEGAAEYQDKSIEDIAEQVQGVYMPQRSQRELEMLAAAKEYYHVLEKTRDTNDVELKSLKERLDRLSEPYAEDIAYIAFLEAKRLSVLKERA